MHRWLSGLIRMTLTASGGAPALSVAMPWGKSLNQNRVFILRDAIRMIVVCSLAFGWEPQAIATPPTYGATVPSLHSQETFAIVGVGQTKADVGDSTAEREWQFEVAVAKRIARQIYLLLEYTSTVGASHERMAVGIRVNPFSTLRSETGTYWWTLNRFFDPALVYFQLVTGAASSDNSTNSGERWGPSLGLSIGWIPLQGIDYGIGFQLSGDFSYVGSDLQNGGRISLVLQFGK